MQISDAATLLWVQEKCYCTSCATKTLGLVKPCPTISNVKSVRLLVYIGTVVYGLRLTISINIDATLQRFRQWT